MAYHLQLPHNFSRKMAHSAEMQINKQLKYNKWIRNATAQMDKQTE